MKNKQKVWGVFFTPTLLDTTTMKDNDKIWNPIALFETMTEAINYRAEKWMGNQTNEDGIEVKEVTLNF